MSVQSIGLAYKDGGSDKVYHAQLDAVGNDLYVVNFQYGRRGSTLATGTKTSSPVPLAQAEKIFDKLVKEKKAKGYSEGESGTPFAGTDKAGEQSGLIPQLLNSIEENQAIGLLVNQFWFMQEKKDGVRQFIKRVGDTIQASNRKGLFVPVAAPIADAVLSLFTKRDPDFVLDGEAMGDVYWPFDIVHYGGLSTMNMRAEARLEMLNGILDTFPTPNIGRIPTAYTSHAKQALYDKIKAERGEGVVFKKGDSKYVPGRPNSGGNQLKYKFVSSTTLRVVAINAGKRSVQVEASVPDGFQSVGNVTIPTNFSVPTVGSLVEIRYLYFFREGSLFQPVYLGPRTDVDCADAVDSLKVKQEIDDDIA